MRIRDIFNKIRNCFRKEPECKKEIGYELPYKLERQRNITNIEAEIIASGIRIIRHEGMLDIENIQIKKHKKKRINKKWLKKYGTKIIMKPHMGTYEFGDKIVGHPDAIKKYLESLL